MPAQNQFGGADVPVQAIPTSELGMIMKSISHFLNDFPKLEYGDSATRAGRLQAWLGAVGQAVQPAGSHLSNWWQWVRQEAEE